MTEDEMVGWHHLLNGPEFEIPWRRDRLPTPVFLGFSAGLAVKNPPAMPET